MLRFLKFLLDLILDIIYPPVCCNCNKIGTFLCESCFSFIPFYSQPLKIKVEECYLDKIYVMSPYDGVIKKMITKYKYQGVIDIGKTLANIIYYYYSIPETDLITYIPITKQKKDKRGFNQTKQICEHLSKLGKYKVVSTLIKVGNYKSQASMKTKKDRMNNLKDSFVVSQKIKQYLKNHPVNSILIIDDVITTGTTLNQAAKKLKELGIKMVYGFTLAHGN